MRQAVHWTQSLTQKFNPPKHVYPYITMHSAVVVPSWKGTRSLVHSFHNDISPVHTLLGNTVKVPNVNKNNIGLYCLGKQVYHKLWLVIIGYVYIHYTRQISHAVTSKPRGHFCFDSSFLCVRYNRHWNLTVAKTYQLEEAASNKSLSLSRFPSVLSGNCELGGDAA